MNVCGMMECNRDEALKAREIAEMRFAAKDVIGAKKFAIKAQNLWPDLDGIGQMLATLNVLLSAEAIINGERDWYAILSINSLAEDEIVKKQYRKLALMLHPDKNKSVGAESAFKLISEAWNVLSDKTRRRIYDQKRTQVAQPKFSQLYGSYGFYCFANGAASTFRNHKSTARRSMGSTKMPCSAPSPKRSTFWTSCNHCKMQYEYFRIYLNQNLFCSNCQESFLATEITSPASGSKLPALWATQSAFHNRDTSNQGRNDLSCGTDSTKFHNITNLEYFNSSKFHWGAFSRTAGAASAVASSSAAALAATVVHQTYEKVKHEREEKQAAARRAASLQKNHASKRTANSISKGTCGFFNGCISDRNQSVHSNNGMPFKKKRNINSDATCNYEIERTDERSKSTSSSLDSHTFTIGTNDGDCGVFGLGWGTLQKGRSFSWEFSHLEIQKVLVQKAKKLVLKKLDECNFGEATMQKGTASANEMI